MNHSYLFFGVIVSALIGLSQFTFAVSNITVRIDSSGQVDTFKVFYRVLLIGDAGESCLEKEDPILSALKVKASEYDSSLVIFLGDNVYPDGLVSMSDPDREVSQTYLDRQINSVIDVDATGLFIPGNHDWNMNDENGWEQVKRQADYVSQFIDRGITFVPLNGCPGPEVFDFGSNIRVIILDTQWWLREKGKRPEPKDLLCPHCDENAIITALDSILNISENKSVIIAAHHPLSTHGSHGGYFNWRDHIFPLTNLNEFLWIPLPVIGSLYPLIRGMGVSEQDLASTEYSNMKEQIESIVIKYPNVLVASGHEHALQVLEGPADNLYLVSGAGVWGDPEQSLTVGDDTIFKGRYEGFMILDYYSDNKVKLSVIRVLNEDGDQKEVYSMWFNY